MKQIAMQSFESECGRAKVFVDNTMPIGVFHDFLLELNGCMIDKMVKVHKENEELSASQKKLMPPQEAEELP